MQRLFATFPEGWPGAGLLFLRAVTAIPVVVQGIAGLLRAHGRHTPLIPELLAACSALLLLAGLLWTPVTGVLMFVAELSLVFAHSKEPWMHVQLGSFQRRPDDARTWSVVRGRAHL